MTPPVSRPPVRVLATTLVKTLVKTLVTTLAIALVVGCASAGSRPSDRTKSPVMLAGARPQWRLPAGPRTGTVLSIQIEVQVDSTGQADPTTLRVTGLGATENADVVRSWMQGARFTPAEREGKPVAGVYRTRVEVRSEVRRMSLRTIAHLAASPLG